MRTCKSRVSRLHGRGGNRNGTQRNGTEWEWNGREQKGTKGSGMERNTNRHCVLLFVSMITLYVCTYVRCNVRFTWRAICESREAPPRNRPRDRTARCSYRIATPSLPPSPRLIFRDGPFVLRHRGNRKSARALISRFAPGTMKQVCIITIIALSISERGVLLP